VPRVLPGKLHRALEDGETITVVDVRAFAAYKQAHVPEAVHIPLEELKDRVGELDENRTIVLYDLLLQRKMSLEAAMLLYGLGFTQIAVLDGGIQRWYSEGYPIEGTLVTPTPGTVGPPWTVTPLPTSTSLSPVVGTATPAEQTNTVTPTVTRSQ
jgi:rhodanese-related sulfurtransferase